MANASEAFLTTVRGVLVSAEAELENEGIDKTKVRDALEELRSLIQPIPMRQFNPRWGFHTNFIQFLGTHETIQLHKTTY